jgi:hypothetical protein
MIKERYMPYQAQINRDNPTLFCFLLDQSGSMNDPFGGQGGNISKAQGLADAVNGILVDIVMRCSEGNTIRDYFDIAILGYGSDRGRVAPVLNGDLARKEVIPISLIGASPKRFHNRVVNNQEYSYPVWIEALGGADTPMCAAFQRVHGIVQDWIKKHRKAFPPIVIHITDGESTDGDPTSLAQKVRSLATDDGNVLLFNCHLSSTINPPVVFPDQRSAVPDKYGQLLFELSSQLTPYMLQAASELQYPVTAQSRGFIFQADLSNVIHFLDIGTRSTVQATLR